MSFLANLPTTFPNLQTYRHHHLIVFLIFLSFIICNIDRVNISVSIIPISQTYHYSKTTQGLILSSFFYGYATTPILGGYLADHLGGRRVLAFGVFAWSLLTILTPLSATLGLIPLIICRIIMGLGEGVAMPAMNACIAYWVPKRERARCTSLIYSGMYFGSVLGFVGSTKIIEWWSWQVVFYLFGGVGLVWTGVWLGVAREVKEEGYGRVGGAVGGRKLEIGDGMEAGEVGGSGETGGSGELNVNRDADNVDGGDSAGTKRPPMHIDLRFVKEDEKLLSSGKYDLDDETSSLNESIAPEPKAWEPEEDDDAERPPISVLMRNKTVWVIIFCHLASAYGFFVLLNWLPTFFNNEFNLNFSKSSSLSALPYAGMFIFAIVGGHLADYLITQKKQSVTNIRKLMQTIGFLGPALFLILVAYTTNPAWGITCMTLGLGLSSFSQSGVYLSHQDIGPKCAGVLLGITNTFATLPGIVGVAITGWILDVTKENWKVVFAIPVGFYLVGTVVYVLGITGRRIF